MDDITSQLEWEYCPPLDSALLQAILSDFDLRDEDVLDQIRRVLDPLKASAAEEEAAGTFDSSATTAYIAEVSATSVSNEGHSDAADTEMSSLSNGVSKLLLDESDGSGASSPRDDPDLNSIDIHTKTLLLEQLFPTINKYTVSHTLGKCNGDWQRALDELLNISAFNGEAGLENETVAIKSTDAFAGNSLGKRGRRKKPKGLNAKDVYQTRRAHSAVSLDSAAVPLVNKWQSATSDIDFIARHTKLSSTLIGSTYYANNGCLRKTILHLLEQMTKSTAKATTVSDLVREHAVELGRDFPTIAAAQLMAIVQLTHPSTASAHEIARALVARPPPIDSGPIIPQYAPVTLSEDEDSMSSNQSSLLRSPTFNGDTASTMAFAHREAQVRLTAQAQAAYKRSKSQRLMGAAAAYYSSVSRDHAASAATYTSAAADALVASQSTDTQLDLHGVIVKDAIRIATREVQVWWNRLGESKVNGRVGAESRQAGFRIVVGVGRHSEGGKGKIGPAVYSALANGGWKVDKGEGVLTVKGMSRT